MPDATITSTASTFGTISGTFAADQSTITGTIAGVVDGTLTGSVGVPGPQGATGATGATGPQGPQGDPGQGVPVGGTTGQYLTKSSGTNYDTSWTTLSLSGYATESWVTTQLGSYLPKAGGYITGDINSNNNSAYRSYNGTYKTSTLNSEYLQLNNSGSGGYALTVEWDGITFQSGKQTVHYPGASILTGYATESWVTAGFYPLSGNPSGFLTSSALTPYLLSSTAASTYAPIATGMPSAGTTGQVLTKNSGTNYDAAWTTIVPGDRYLTTSTTSNSVSNGSKTFTVGTGLSYSTQQDVVIAYDASNHMHAIVTSYTSGTGVLVVDVQNHTGSGTYASWTVNVGGTTPLTSVAWGGITGTLSSQIDLQSALDAKLSTATASSTYAPLDSPPLIGNVTITTNSASPALVIEQSGAGDVVQFRDQTSDTTYSFIDAVGKVNTVAATTSSAGFSIPHGTAPTTPVNGDIWTTTSGLFARVNNGTQQYANLGGNITFSNSSGTYTNGTATGTVNFATGATISGSTKTVNIGTSGAAGSTTTIAIGSTTGTSTTTLQGTTNGVTVAADTNSVALATTAFVVGQGYLKSATAASTYYLQTNPAGYITSSALSGYATEAWVSGIGYITDAPSDGSQYARKDGAWDVVTPATNYITSVSSPLSVNTGNLSVDLSGYATETWVGTQGFLDTSGVLALLAPYAAIDSQAFTGTPSLPTGTIAVTQSPGNNSTAVATTAFVTAAVPSFATVAESKSFSSTAKVISPNTSMRSRCAPNVIDIFRGAHAYTATGTMGTGGFGWYTTYMTLGTAGACSGRYRTFGTSQIDQTWIVVSQGYRNYINFSKQIICTGRCYFESVSTDSNVISRFAFGKAENSGVGDLARKGFGWRFVGGASSPKVELQVHNGTTLTNVATTFTPSSQVFWDWEIISDGAGNVTLTINGSVTATSSAGPTGDTSYSGTAPVIWQEEIQALAASAGGQTCFARGKLVIVN